MTIAKKTLGTGDIAAAVQLPEGEDKNEWFAMHVVDFYNEISLLYGIVAEIDTAERFPVMGAGMIDFETVRTQSFCRPNPWFFVFMNYFRRIRFRVIVYVCILTSGKKYEYHWADVTTQKPLKLSAPAYVWWFISFILSFQFEKQIFHVQNQICRSIIYLDRRST